MTQKPPKKKRRLPKDIVERPDHDVMEAIIGKKAMKEVDRLVKEPAKGRKSKSEPE